MMERCPARSPHAKRAARKRASRETLKGRSSNGAVCFIPTLYSLSLFYMLWLNDPVLHAVSRLLLLLWIPVLLSF